MEPATIVLLVLGGILAIFLLGVFFGSFFTIEQAHAGVVQRLGKFLRIAQPGLNFKAPYLDVVVANISLQVQQLDVKVETKTKSLRPDPDFRAVQSYA
jgi:regulator of protease activity HflC (stomatin/prohibitin superfamily)